jgi:hypothetical protein
MVRKLILVVLTRALMAAEFNGSWNGFVVMGLYRDE